MTGFRIAIREEQLDLFAEKGNVPPMGATLWEGWPSSPTPAARFHRTTACPWKGLVTLTTVAIQIPVSHNVHSSTQNRVFYDASGPQRFSSNK